MGRRGGARAACATAAAIGWLVTACSSTSRTTDVAASELDATADSAGRSGLDAATDARPSGTSALDDAGDSRPAPWAPASCVPMGAAPVALASGLPSPVGGLQVDANNAYWIDTAVRSAALDGGGARVLASSVQISAWGNASIAIDEANVYWNNARTVMSVAKQGGAPANLTDGALGQSGTYASGLVIRGTSAVWAWGAGAKEGPYWGAIVETPLDGGASVPLFEGTGPHLYQMTADDAGIYYGGVDLWALPAGGGDGGIPIAMPTEGIEGIAIDAQRVVWTSFDSVEGAVKSAPRDGGSSTKLVTGGWIPSTIVIDGPTIYWTIAAGNPPAPGAIMRANIDGTSAAILACDTSTPMGLAVDATSVYWTDSGTNGNDGALYRLTPK